MPLSSLIIARVERQAHVTVIIAVSLTPATESQACIACSAPFGFDGL